MQDYSISTLNKADVLERFWSKVDKSQSCWLWQNAIGTKGYGIFTIKKRNCVASRVAWVLTYGPIPQGKYVCHHCDTPACVNPDHLFLGTQKDNLHDMSRKGRRGIWHPAGEMNPKAKLTKEQVAEIRQVYRRYDRVLGGGALAKRFGVSLCAITAIIRGDTWKEGN